MSKIIKCENNDCDSCELCDKYYTYWNEKGYEFVEGRKNDKTTGYTKFVWIKRKKNKLDEMLINMRKKQKQECFINILKDIDFDEITKKKS